MTLIPLFFLIDRWGGEDRHRALMAGYKVSLAKPVEPAELIATVARVLGRDPS